MKRVVIEDKLQKESTFKQLLSAGQFFTHPILSIALYSFISHFGQSNLFYFGTLSLILSFLSGLFFLLKYLYASTTFLYLTPLKALSIALLITLSHCLLLQSISFQPSILQLAVAHLAFESFFGTSLGRLILWRQFEVRHYLALTMMAGGVILAWVPWTQDGGQDKVKLTLSILCMAGSKASWLLACVLQKKWYLVQGYLRRKQEWSFTKPILEPKESEIGEGGKLKAAQINPNSHLFLRCILNHEENRLLLHIEAAIKRELAKEGLSIQIGREESLEYLESLKNQHLQAMIRRRQALITKSQETKRIMALDVQLLDQEMKSRTLSQKMTNMSVSKIMLWEIDVMNNKLNSFERRPDIYNDWEDTLYEELSLKQAIQQVQQYDSSHWLHQQDILNQLQRGTYLDLKDDTNQKKEEVVLQQDQDFAKELEDAYKEDEKRIHKEYDFYISPFQDMVEKMVKSIPDFGVHRHIFPLSDIDGETIEQLKIDVLFDRSFYNDRHIFSINQEDNLKMTAFINVIQLPLMFILTVLKGDKIHGGFFNLLKTEALFEEVFILSNANIIIFVFISLIQLAKPHLDFNLLNQQGNQQKIFMIDLLSLLFFSSLALVFMDQTLDVPIFELFGLILTTATAYTIQFMSRNTLSNDFEAKSAIESVKALFKYPRTLDLEEIDIKLYSIYDLLGLQGLMSVLFDMALSMNKRQAEHTCVHALDLREQFDVYGESRSKLWGDGFPRPSVEMTEKAWKLNEVARVRGQKMGIKVFLDHDIDYSTYPQALQLFETIRGWNYDNGQLFVSRMRRDMIIDKFSDILDVGFIYEMEQKHMAKAERRRKCIAQGLNASDTEDSEEKMEENPLKPLPPVENDGGSQKDGSGTEQLNKEMVLDAKIPPNQIELTDVEKKMLRQMAKKSNKPSFEMSKEEQVQEKIVENEEQGMDQTIQNLIEAKFKGYNQNFYGTGLLSLATIEKTGAQDIHFTKQDPRLNLPVSEILKIRRVIQ